MPASETIHENDFLIDEIQIAASICREDFYFFVQEFWDVIIAEEPIWNWHIKYICEELQSINERVTLKSRGVDENGKPLQATRLPKEYDYVIINVPPGSSKSTIATIMYPLWVWTVDATQRFICGSYASTPAEDLADKAFTIYNSEKFKAYFPELHSKKANGGKTHFKNGLKGERLVTSTGSAITGIHAHQIIIDDPMNPKIAASETERNAANKWISETISSRKVDKKVSIIIIIMQRLHENDSTGYLLEKKGLEIKHICIPAEIDKKTLTDVKPGALMMNYVDGLFDVNRAPRNVLNQIKIDLGSYGYAGQMLQRPSPPEGGILKKDWFPIVRVEKHPAIAIRFQIDTAYTENTDNDPTAIIGYYEYQNQIFITSVISVYKEFPDFITWLPTYLETVGYTDKSLIHCEPKATGLSVVQTIKKTTELNIKISDPPTDDKLTRVNIISPKIEALRVSLHFGGWNESFINQCVSFPYANHDDELDCLVAIVIRHLMKAKPKKDFSKMGFA